MDTETVNYRPTRAGRIAPNRGAYEVIAEEVGVDKGSAILIEADARQSRAALILARELGQPALSEQVLP